MAQYRITIGDLDFNGDSILLGSLDIATVVDIVGSELAADTFTVVVDFVTGECFLFSPADYDGVLTQDLYFFGTADVVTGDLTAIPYGTPINFYDGNTRLAKFYVHDVARISKTRYQINAMSVIGFLENIRHMGGVYASATAGDMISEIVAGTFSYTINAAVAEQIVVGWLPIDTARANLHKLLFALGIAVIKDNAGDVVFTFLSNNAPTPVPDDRIYLGGNVTYNALATAVEVTEHSFYKGNGTAATQIFSNAGGIAADHLFVAFSEPHYDIQSSDLTIHESGDNYAIVSGVGTLMGKPYRHETKVYQQAIPDSTGIIPNVISSSEDTLVNHLNAFSVLDRLVAYYGTRKTVNADIILAGEKAGTAISFTDAFGDVTTGFLAQMDVLASTFLRARCKILSGYTPTGQGNHYEHAVLITQDGTWTVPAGVTAICIGLIGGGTGGYGGNDGEVGAGGWLRPSHGETGDQSWRGIELGDYYAAQYSWYDPQPLKKGGAGGAPGSPGKSYVINATVTPGEVITIALGSGGSGGARNGGAGTAGTATTASSSSLGSISSELGLAVDNGFMDVFTGKTFAAIGKTGTPGGDGGQTDLLNLQGNSGYDGLSGGSVGEYSGGAGGAGLRESGNWAFASGGGGGGAAVGAAGGAGIKTTEENAGVTIITITTGSGGAGADATAPSQAYYGCGGDGGNGGGAGGNAGAGKFEGMNWHDYYFLGERGAAGKGSAGGAGGEGAVIIYY